MTPDLPVGDFVAGLRREVERNAIRTRNGIKYLAGSEWAPREPTPSDVVWSEGKARLRRYGRDRSPQLSPPVLAFLGLVGRASIFDLWSRNSFVGRLLDAGFDPFVLDWGEPDEEDAANTLETYVMGLLPRALTAVRRASGARDVSIIGYCMGGNLALQSLAGDPRLPVRNLVTMATAVDWGHLGPVARALRDGRLDPQTLVDETGNVPPGTVATFFRLRQPTANLVQYANLWENLWNDDFMEGYQAMGRWLREQIALPGAAFQQIVQQWLRDDGFLNDALRLGGRRVSLADIEIPTLAVIATRDDLITEAAAAPIADVLTGTRVDVMRLDAGHASLTTGRTAAKVTVPRIVEWLTEHSVEATRA